ncbi:MAG: 50S ribosomal protein L24 [Planctomycetaceae bacterium]|nr:50S ribosomal protein L24 [Planctomycetaceae bacterium]|tara:strand:- start:363 stop:710 length:348 start_codon:yes stop_codon:yes gene_type:complete
MLIRTGDTVEVIAGADRGTKSRVIQVDRDKGKALVENINRVYKHVKRSQKHPQGGRLSKEMPVQLSNVMYVCQSCGERSRLGARYSGEGAKERFCKKCGASAGDIAPAHVSHAKK